MKAKALICDERQNFTIEEVELQGPEANQIAVRTVFSGVSIGTEFALIRHKLDWGPYPICTGYMNTGIVEELGSEVNNFKVGDRVYVRCNDTMNLANGEAVSCVSGAHCSHSVLNPNTDHGADILPANADMENSSMFVMPAVGLYGVDMANPRLGQNVLVYGSGLIGLGVIAACVHRGCVVTALDINQKQLALAKEMGADHLIDTSTQNASEELKKIDPDGADMVFECTGIPKCVDSAIELCKPYGSFIWQGNYGSAPVSMDFLTPHMKRLKMHFPCDDGLQPCRKAVVRNMAMGALKWEKTITHRIVASEAPAMFEMINKGEEKDIVGVTINWENI